MGRQRITNVKFTSISLGPVVVSVGIDRVRRSWELDSQIDSESGDLIDGVEVDRDDGDGVVGSLPQKYSAILGGGAIAGFEEVIGGGPVCASGIGSNPEPDEI